MAKVNSKAVALAVSLYKWALRNIYSYSLAPSTSFFFNNSLKYNSLLIKVSASASCFHHFSVWYLKLNPVLVLQRSTGPKGKSVMMNKKYLMLYYQLD